MYQDTEPRQLARYIQLLRAQPPAERLRQAGELTDAVLHLAVLGIRQRHPRADELEVRVRLAELLHGREVARRLFGAHPALVS
jgi:hypothetical protein